jgi:3-oxoacyl-[acyl-carrier-protein] synthase II
MVIEDLDHAKSRGAEIYAEISGFGMSGDAFHMTSPPENGTGAALCMKNALLHAQMNPDDVDYINAHGTSTPAGDLAETAAIKAVFGTHAKKLCVSSSKSMIGHLLGASGAAEAIISVLTLKDQVIPPTINLENPDDGCDLDYVPGQARDQMVNVVLSNSFGFGGTNGSLIFSRYAPP